MVLNVKRAHVLLGHPSEALTRQIAKALKWTLTRGGLGVCESCAVAKAKQKNLPQIEKNHTKLDKTQQTAYLDQCTVRDTFGSKTPYVWWICVLGYAGLKFSKFFRSKNSMIEPAAEFFYQLTTKGNGPAKLRMDNGGEN
jgi:hypothetical protein